MSKLSLISQIKSWFFPDPVEKLNLPPKNKREWQVSDLKQGNYVKLVFKENTIEQLLKTNIFTRFTQTELLQGYITGLFIQTYLPEKSISNSKVIEIVALSKLGTTRIIPVLEQELKEIETIQFD